MLKNLLEKILPNLENGENLRSLTFSNEEQKLLRGFQLLTTKPVLYVANVSENGFNENKYLEQVINFANTENAEVVAICADIEEEISRN